MDWPRTHLDRWDMEFWDDPPAWYDERTVAAYRSREMCGCGNHLHPEETHGVCTFCMMTGARTARPAVEDGEEAGDE